MVTFRGKLANQSNAKEPKKNQTADAIAEIERHRERIAASFPERSRKNLYDPKRKRDPRNFTECVNGGSRQSNLPKRTGPTLGVYNSWMPGARADNPFKECLSLNCDHAVYSLQEEAASMISSALAKWWTNFRCGGRSFSQSSQRSRACTVSLTAVFSIFCCARFSALKNFELGNYPI
jgi:hypothetical protein